MEKEISRFAQTVDEYHVGDTAKLSVSFLERSTPRAGELREEAELGRYQLLFRNKHQLWPGFFATAAIFEGGQGLLYARDTTFEPGDVLRFCEGVCEKLGRSMTGFDSRTYDGFVLYEVSLSSKPHPEA